MAKSKLTIEPKVIELEPKYNKEGKRIIQIQPFLEQWNKVYNNVPFEQIPQIDKDKYFEYLENAKEIENKEKKEFWQNISHRETDEILRNAKGNHKSILLAFLERIEQFSLSAKNSNTLFCYFNEQLYYMNLASESPKFAIEVFINKLEILPNNLQKYIFIECARAYFEMEYNTTKNENYKVLYTLLSANVKRQKNIIDISKKQNQTTTQPTPPQKEIKPIDNTLHQQFLIFHYLLKHLEISTNSIDKTQIARFIQFATQKQLEAKKIQNTSIYKLVDNPFNGYKKEQGTTQTNLQKVRELFESIGLKEIAEMVSKDII